MRLRMVADHARTVTRPATPPPVTAPLLARLIARVPSVIGANAQTHVVEACNQSGSSKVSKPRTAARNASISSLKLRTKHATLILAQSRALVPRCHGANVISLALVARSSDHTL
jgi:hypothetical protein